MENSKVYEAIRAWSQIAASPDPIPDSKISRPYKCCYDTCEASFLHRENWIQHIDSHSEKKLHVCSHPGCEERFFFGDTLAAHLEDHASPNKYASPLPPLDMDTDSDFGFGDPEADYSSPVSPHAKRVQDPAYSRQSSVPKPSPSYTPRKRKDSASSVGSCSSAGSGNSDPKALCEDLPDFFETYQLQKHWKRGASILSDLNYARLHVGIVESKKGFPLLRETMESLSFATQEVNLNAKAWSLIGITLSRHARESSSYSTSRGISAQIQGYIRVLKDILALWIRTVDPLITLLYSALPAYQLQSLEKQVSKDRHNLFLFTKEHGTGEIDEDAIHEQRDRLDETFKAIVDGSTGDLSLVTSSKSSQANHSSKRMRSNNEGDHEARPTTGDRAKRRKRVTNATYSGDT